MRTANRTYGLALSVLMGLLAGGIPAAACDAGQRPNKQPNAALTANVASMEKIGIYKRPAAKPDAAKANDTLNPSIVGLWHSVYTYSGQIVDQSFETYRDDGSEMEVDLGPPAIGNVCNGTWEQTGTLTFKLTHPAWNFDENGNLIGTVIIRDVVTLDRSGNKFTGTETVDLFDANGRFQSHSEGVVKSTRVSPQ